MTELAVENQQIIQIVSKQLKLKEQNVKSVIVLLDEGNTVPFISRYRKEQTNNLDEMEVQSIKETYDYQVQLHKRKEEVIRLIDEQGKLTEELKNDLLKAEKLQQVEDLYRPYKQKRRTRATIAKEKGLEPLAKQIWEQTGIDLNAEAVQYFSEEHELNEVEDVLAGASDIIAEWISDEPSYREKIRKLTYDKGSLQTEMKKNAEDEKGIFQMYYEYHEPVVKTAPHRVLAMNRGEKEKVLKVMIEPPEEMIMDFLHRSIIKSGGEEKAFLENAIEDSYKRLIQPSIERDIRSTLTEGAEEHAIDIFAKNLKNLLLQPPLKGKTILGVDPAFRTGCKLAVVDETGQMKSVDVIYPTAPKNDVAGAEKKLMKVFEDYPIELIAIGNGTASRETEQFIAEMIGKHNLDVAYLIANEAGASVYSASKLAREEFPDLQVEERSAVSIARRVQDPLSELVKIDPKSIGVGQYQHDVSQKKLNDSLTFVVESAVNQVGVNVNTASSSLLQYISGLNKTVANNIVKYRMEEGKFTNRKQIKDVPRLGAKTYEQAIGFLRVMEGDEPLDATSIHPESYKATKQLLKRLGLSSEGLGSETLNKQLDLENLTKLTEELDIGKLTLEDIVEDLKKPNRDPRDEHPKPLLKTNVLAMEDLEQGMELQGTVRNVVDFGAFVDVGVKQDGLVHISKLSNRFVKNPLDVVAVGDIVTVWVDEVDTKRERIALTMVPSGK
ncbi:RNA-binding transcriptional accessory protein [Halalkalibacillus sediminis]|uniref:RNA-binding transcriptional accessory protein n=1 Tax=Halalkalibacillus sediminis TaxID=2018042 RepID=A0A2I0QRP5_9BACI|nr:Tex family protein [Halalkalibacillus sediminis]PKR77001.1 RNA-binding transcriptional accessory protein [Halalkalibacillus sediminis]